MNSAPDVDKELLGVPPETYGSSYAAHLLEQYRLYVEMTDRTSERRQSANTFLLTVNTVLVAILGLASGLPGRSTGLIFLGATGVAGMALAFTWYRLIGSYRQLNSGKFRIVHALERHLPLRPYEAEWTTLGRGENPHLYRPFTSVETWIPALFFLLYLAILLLSILAAAPALSSCF